MKQYKPLLILLFLFLIPILNTNAQQKVTHPKNEFRAVWIATVVNIDWPKSSTDAIEKEKTDFLEILDTYKKLNYNAVIVQIRSVGDAFYKTELAPWSRYLTGKEGKAPKDNFDILEWMIAESHDRGFEFHAWLNPYRATFDTKIETLSPNHDFFKHRNWMIKYGEKGKEKFYYNPGLPEVQAHLTKVVEEVVINYDIDAIHFDDYFYPYKVKGKNFNDTDSFKKYGNGLSIADWRRSNVNVFLKNIYSTIKNIKPWVQFGISPFGVWRNKSVDPKGSDTEAGQTNYDDLYADPIAWMEGKYIDYMLPQLYWSMEHPKASYTKLIKWWSENTTNTNLYIGNSTYKIKSDSDKKWNNPLEIPNQIDLTRTFKNIQGNAFFSAKGFVNTNQDVTQILLENQYKHPALPYPVPSAMQIVADSPSILSFQKEVSNYTFKINYPLQSKIRYAVIYGAKNKSKIDLNDPSQIIYKIAIKKIKDAIIISLQANKFEGMNTTAITFIDFYGNESNATIIDLTKEIK